MKIGIPREVKDGEARVGATPETVHALVGEGHVVLVEAGAGSRTGFEDQRYLDAGGCITPDPGEVFACSLIVKVKELQPTEFARLRPGTMLMGYQQMAREPRLLNAVLAAGVTCIAYENVTDPDGGRPMLAPMSTIAGSMSAQIAAWALQRREGPLSGSGVLLSGLEGVPPGKVLIIGDGIAGQASARAFLAMGCRVTLLGLDSALLRKLEDGLGGPGWGALRTALSTSGELTACSMEADVVVGAVAIPGRLAPKLITREMLRSMRPGSVFIDIGIDMGGIAETSRQTKLSEPLYVEEGVLHYCVPNIPALVPATATWALTEATLPYIKILARKGLRGAIHELPGLGKGLLTHDGRVVNAELAKDTGHVLTPYPE